MSGTEIDTPYLAVDELVLDRNIARAATQANNAGITLRPHVKTHKCIEVAAKQMGSGAIGLTVATIGEAAVFADAGFADLFLAYPLWLTDNKARRLRAVAENAQLRLAVDSAAGAGRLATVLAGAPAEVLVEIDSGHHRTGVTPANAGAVASAARAHGLNVVGVFTFPGHGYAPGGRAAAARQEGEALSAAADALRTHGIDPVVRSGGSTPTLADADGAVLTEVRPGVYPFNDAQQWELGSCAAADIALTAIGTVVHRRGSIVIVDAGSKILSADRPAWTTGFGRLPDHPAARITALSEHHATVEFSDDPPPLGAYVRIAPNHVCSAVNLADQLVVTTASGREQWTVAARGTNS